MEAHYRRVKKKITKGYLIRFEVYIREELHKAYAKEIDKYYDDIYDKLMNGDPKTAIKLSPEDARAFHSLIPKINSPINNSTD